MRGAALALILCGAALVAGCGEEGPPDEGRADQAATALTIEVTADGSAGDPTEAMIAEVACPGDAAAVCNAVAALPDDPAAEIPPQTPCTEIYGGPDELTVAGTLRGRPIDATLTRVDGCEIERFDRFGPLLEALFPRYQPGSALGA